MTVIQPNHWYPGDEIQLDMVSLEIVKSCQSLAIQAGPGAGKTELLAQRAAFLLQTNTCPQPRRILAISFKRDAAKNLKERVSKRVGPEVAKRFDSFTFDAFAKGILDRFREALPEWVRPQRDYEIGSRTRRQWESFGIRPGLDSPFDEESFTVEQVKNGHAYFGANPSPFGLAPPQPKSAMEAMTLRFWEIVLADMPSSLTFDMVRTLALTIIHHNPQVKNALLHTYSHVFLDEFQDTALPQYTLLHEIFSASGAILTAVGDNKQLIMTFAGASRERFPQFSRDFCARTVSLTSNFRSNRRIVEIINSIARNIEKNAVEVTCSRPDDPLPQSTDGFVHFNGADDQALGLAQFISGEIKQNGINPNDFIILVRQKADGHEAGLKDAFRLCGLVLRNEARILGESGISLQDVFTEPLAQIVIQFIQVAVEDRRREAYLHLSDFLAETHGSRDDRGDSQFFVESCLRETAKAIGPYLNVRPSETSMTHMVETLIEKLGEDRVKRLAREYRNAHRFECVKSGLILFLEECAVSSGSWEKFTDFFLGVDQVRLMTIHKSKGLEAHTIIFLSLQDDSFYYLANVEEEKLPFFVAVSRAEERVFFTKTQGDVSLISPLYELLGGASVPVLECFPVPSSLG